MRRFRNILYLICSIATAFLGGVAVCVHAETAKPVFDDRTFYVCLGRHGGPSVLGESEYQARIEDAPRAAAYCRKELRWEPDTHWLCRLDDYVLLADYPIDRVGIVAAAPKLAELFAGRTFECRKLSGTCAGGRYLLRRKHCYHRIESYTKDYWRQFAKQANQEAVELEQPCEYEEDLAVDYAVQNLRTGCRSESCVLNHSSEVWHTALKLFDPEGYDEHDFSYFKPERVVARSRKLERRINRPGVYCLEHEPHQIAELSDPVFEYRLTRAKFLSGFPKGWPLELPETAEHGQETNTALDSLRCKDDSDCVQGKGKGVCMIKSMALGGAVGSNPSYRCVCMKGPVVFGCVSKSID